MLYDTQEIVDELDKEINRAEKEYKEHVIDGTCLSIRLFDYLKGLKKAQAIFLCHISLPY